MKKHLTTAALGPAQIRADFRHEQAIAPSP
jgi:hypothetical protein